MALRQLAISFCVLVHSLFAQPLSFSQASQDRFVCALLPHFLKPQDPSYYLEIGAFHPIEINNTYFLECSLHWKGVSIDISDDYVGFWEVCRANPLLIEDALQSDYAAILSDFPTTIDYLSLDIDGGYETVLERLPFDRYLFRVITIEHDAYRFGDSHRQKEREILFRHGYYLLCADVANKGYVYEDWWVHPSLFSAELLSKLSSLNLHGKEHTELLQILHLNL